MPQLASGLAELLPRLGDELGEHLRGRSVGARQQAGLVRRVDEPVEQVEVAVAGQRPLQARPGARDAARPGGAAAARPGPRRPAACAPRSFRNRSSRTSTSRTAPSASASHASSVRNASAHSASRTTSKVRRSLRSRRVLTRAWWTPRVPRSSRTIGSWTSRRCTAAAMACCTTAAMVGCGPSGSGEGSGGASAGGPSARTSLGVGSGSPAPAFRSASTTPSIRPSGAPGMASTSSSRKRAATRSPSSTVTSSSLTSARARPPPSRSTTTRRSLWRRATASSGARRSSARHGAGQLVGHLPGWGIHLDLGAVHRHAARARAGHLQRPATGLAALAEPVPQRDVRADEAQIGGVVVGRVEMAVTGLGGGHAVVHPAEVGQDEAGPGRQLHLALGVAAGSFARPALSHPPRPCGAGPGRARRAGAGSRCRRRR